MVTPGVLQGEFDHWCLVSQLGGGRRATWAHVGVRVRVSAYVCVCVCVCDKTIASCATWFVHFIPPPSTVSDPMSACPLSCSMKENQQFSLGVGSIQLGFLLYV